MRSLLTLALLSAAAALAQAAGPEGVWDSDEKYNGEPRYVIELHVVDGRLGGKVTMRGVTDDDANATTLNLVIESAEVDGAKVSFKTKVAEDNIAEWEMTISGSTATASIVVDGDGPVNDPQKWTLKRVQPAPAGAKGP